MIGLLKALEETMATGREYIKATEDMKSAIRLKAQTALDQINDLNMKGLVIPIIVANAHVDLHRLLTEILEEL